MRLFLCLVLALASIAGHTKERLEVQTLMTPEEYESSGLAKLSPAELDALNAWLVRYTAHEAPTVRKTSAEVKKEVRDADQDVIRSQIEGEFNGWNGKTLFRLKNGQVWKQRLPATYRTSSVEPDVEIYQGVMGLYWMRVVGTGRSVGVAREE